MNCRINFQKWLLVTKNNGEFKCQVWNCSRKVSELYTDFYTTQEFTRQFDKLDAVKKTFELKDPEGKVYLNIKMIDLNRHTLALYKRLDDKNRQIIAWSMWLLLSNTLYLL